MTKLWYSGNIHLLVSITLLSSRKHYNFFFFFFFFFIFLRYYCWSYKLRKVYFTTRFLKYLDEMVDKPISEVIYCAPEKSYPDLAECGTPVRYLDWLPNAEMFGDKKNRLVIIDDMMRESDEGGVDLFTKHSHHLSVSVIFICQNIFHKGKGQRDISLNSHYIVAYKSPRDRGQLAILARQICPGNTQYANETFADATKNPYGYLLLDL